MDRLIFDAMAKVQSIHWWFVGRKEIFRSVIDGFELPMQARILEVGAGSGTNLDMLASFGELHACESDQNSREFCRSNGWSVIDCLLPDGISQLNGRYDLICLFDVLEHIECDQEVIKSLSQLLSPGGYLLISCPAYQWMFTGYDKNLGHFRRYTAKALANLVSNSELQIYRKGYFNTFLFPIVAFFRIMERLGKKVSDNTVELPSPWLNRFLLLLFRSELLIIRHFLFPYGTSALVAARKI